LTTDGSRSHTTWTAYGRPHSGLARLASCGFTGDGSSAVFLAFFPVRVFGIDSVRFFFRYRWEFGFFV
jgi:hypothetical protein